MGKPFKKELSVINDTYIWAKSLDISTLKNSFEDLLSAPTFVVGSGGSISACHLLSILQQSKGTISRPITPLELHHSTNALRNSNIFFISASGKNSDILFAYNTAVKNDPMNIFGLCMKRDTKLENNSLLHSISKITGVDCPAGKDGFLATNSLISYFTILSRIFGYESDIENFELSQIEQNEIYDFTKKLDSNFSLITLYAGWGQPVAIDLESKFTEAGLGSVLLSDIRNFGHGRHNWFDKKKEQSAIVALVTPDEKILVEKTLALLPDYIPKLIISTAHTSAAASIDLLVKSFHFVNAVGEKVGIDPGRPGVPAYGSKLYNLKYQSLLANKNVDYVVENAILRKTHKKYIEELGADELKYWLESLENYKKKFKKAKFGAIMLDYDGTLSTKEERKEIPCPEIIQTLNSYLKKGFVIGIVTGRGKSIRETLVKFIDKKYRENIIIGYYNGAVIANLEDETQPNISANPHNSLKLIFDAINNYVFFDSSLDLALRPLQLTIEKGKVKNWTLAKQIITELIANLQLKDIQVLESGHSMDIIIRPQVSKTNIFKYCIKQCKALGISESFVCIGDKGKFPGNDYELLQSDYSLSVDEVSADPNTCWNLSQIGQKGIVSCLHYLSLINYHKSYFTIKL